MKKKSLYLLLSLLLFMAANAEGQEWCDEGSCCYEDCRCIDRTPFYTKILYGANFLDSTTADGNDASYETGYIVAGSLGYCWHYGLRLEAEYAFRKNNIKNIDFFVEGSSKSGYFETSSCMANLLWDLPLALCKWNIQPFIGAGIGYDFQKMHSSNSRIIFNQNWNHFSWQLIAGLAYPIFRNTEITLEYKFHQGGCQFKSNSIGVGLLYKFDLRKFWEQARSRRC